MTFALKVILSFFIGGLFVAGVVWLTEKLGARVGAAIAGLPLVTLLGLVFICITSGPTITKEACLAMPIFVVSALFYGLVYEKSISILKIKSRDFVASLIALFAWVVTNLIIISRVVPNINFVIAIVISLIGIIIFYLLFYSYPSVGLHRHIITQKVNITRFFIAGSVVATSVIFARLLGPTWGGLAASFPVTIATSLYFLDKSQSDDFTKSFVKELPLALVSLLIFIIVLYATLLNMNAIGSFLIAIITAFIYAFIHTKLRRKSFYKVAKKAH